MKRSLLCGIALLGSSAAWAAPSAPALVDGAWVAAHACRPGIVLLDIRNPIGGGGDLTAYLRDHIPCAVYSNYANGGWRINVGGAPGLVPPVPALEKLIGGLGIGNNTRVVIYSGGGNATDMGGATRVFWTFKYLGDNNVSILDGGYAAYVAGKHPVQPGFNKPTPTIFAAHPRPALLASEQDVQQAMKSGIVLVDNRPSAQYLGINRTANVVVRNGTIPGAHNLPENWITQNDGGTFRSPTALRALYAAAHVPTTGKEINFCNTGHWASLGWFASYELLGDKQARLYAGSMSQWSRNPALPMVEKVHD
ncbi:MAG: rhodanese-like domain-containing protein [Betaproteobacteria bacterium]|nr:rhodanese-like domain-containing protein [Betaproteobacteria bacterium]